MYLKSISYEFPAHEGKEAVSAINMQTPCVITRRVHQQMAAEWPMLAGAPQAGAAAHAQPVGHIPGHACQMDADDWHSTFLTNPLCSQKPIGQNDLVLLVIHYACSCDLHMLSQR